MLSASIPNPTNQKIEDASKDFIPYLERYCARLLQPEEVGAWEESQVDEGRKGIRLEGGSWEEKREVEMLRSNPAFVLRQWVLEELISKLEETGVERIEEGRKELARVLDVRLLVSPLLFCPQSLHISVLSIYLLICIFILSGSIDPPRERRSLIADVDSALYQLVRSWS